MRFLAFALLVAALPMTGLNAAPLETPAGADGYRALAEVMSGGSAPALDGSLRGLAARMQASDAILAEAEQTFPGICTRLAATMRPIFLRHQQRVARAYRPRMIAVLRGAMSEDEAAAVAAFYRSPLGARISASVAASVQNASARADDDRAGGLGADLTRDEIAYIDRFFGKGAGRKLTPVLPRLTALRADMERTPLAAEDRQEIKAIVTRAVALFRVLPDAPSPLPAPKPLKLGPTPLA